MKVLYSGSTACSSITIRRLLLLADEIGFMDRPSIVFDNWGTVGHDSPFRANIDYFNDKPVQFSIHKPPNGPANDFYRAYIEADLNNEAFRRTVLSGMVSDASFSEKFLAPKAQYEDATGEELAKLLHAEKSLLTVPIQVDRLNSSPGIDAPGLVANLQMLLTNVSIELTNSMVISQETDLIPVTDDYTFNSLLALRLTDPTYGNTDVAMTPSLGMEITRAVIPDEVLQQLEIERILEYRSKTAEAYIAWSAEINKLALELDDLSPTKSQDAITKLIRKSITPQLTDYRNEMRSVGEKMFGELLKSAPKAGIPALYIAYLSHTTMQQALALFAAVGTIVLPAAIDQINSRRSLGRKYAISYLVRLADKG